MAKTKIVVIRMKEILYTAIFVGLGVLLILLLIFMFLPKQKEKTQSTDALYKAGIYTCEIALGDSNMNLLVTLDENHINAVELENLDESVTTMYPLLKPSLDEISQKLIQGTSIDDITLNEESKYTQTMLLESIESVLESAKCKP